MVISHTRRFSVLAGTALCLPLLVSNLSGSPATTTTAATSATASSAAAGSATSASSPRGAARTPDAPAARAGSRAGVARAAASEYAATITRTAHGIPHITASSFAGLGFGSGYATAQTSTCTLADIVLTARAQRSKFLGPEAPFDDGVAINGTNFQIDALVTDLRNRRVVEKLLADPQAGPGDEARQMVRGYAAGVNAYLKDLGGSRNITDPACRNAAYIKPDATALDVWYGVYLANIIASTGNFLKEIVGATPPTLQDPGLPSLATFGIAPPELPDAEELTASLRTAESFGSNATAIGGDASTTGSGMLLGNPHFPWNGRFRFTQQHLTIPGKYDVAGGSLIGSPVVNIGWNSDVAWSHTVSTAYRFTPYEYRTVLSPFTYLSANGGLKQIEKRNVTVTVKNPDGSLGTRSTTFYRTPQGYVIDSPAQLMGWTPLSFFAIRDANGEQLRTIDTFLNMGKATNVRDLLARQDAAGGMPWVNTTAADRFGDVLYADHSVVPNVSNELANRCMTPIGRVLQQLAGLPALDGALAESVCAWGTDSDAQRPGIFGSANLPDAVRRDWVMNANDSYWLPNPAQRLEGFARIIGCEKCQRTLRTRMVDQYVIDGLAGGNKIAPVELRGYQHENRVRGAEVMGANGDLVKICRAAAGGDACPVLAAWDMTSNVESRGNHIFEEFVKRLPKKGLLVGGYFKVPYSNADPVNTPRDIDETNPKVIRAMKEAIGFLRSKNIPMNATWGSLQVAGDRGAPPISLGGGLGDQAGNANALASRGVLANGSFFRPITYGSSHIQAISFLPGGRVDARTILTYGLSDNPTSPWSRDQTRLFSEQRWVSFAFTPAQIADGAISTIRVRR